MKYFIDFEFLEGDVPCRIKGFNIPKWLIKPNNTIQPISVGLVSSDGREYYAISKEFNLKEAWNRFQYDALTPYEKYHQVKAHKVYWLRDNVLKPIFKELRLKELKTKDDTIENIETYYPNRKYFKEFKRLINKYGKTNKQIAEEIIDFINPDLMFHVTGYNNSELKNDTHISRHFDKHNVTSDGEYYYAQPEFYGYYSDYDWVVFCWLFGRMIELPKGFPMYCIDLKQELECKRVIYNNETQNRYWVKLEEHNNYPKQTNEHNARNDAKWNKQLYEFLNTL